MLRRGFGFGILVLVAVVAGFMVAAPPAEAAAAHAQGQTVLRVKTLRSNSMQSAGIWNEFYNSAPGIFKPNSIYHVTFSYQVVARQPKGIFYGLFRQPGEAWTASGWARWKGKAGKTGVIHMRIFTPPFSSYQLTLGIENKGAVVIKNLRVKLVKTFVAPLTPGPARTWTAPANATWYIDSAHGNDANSGRSPAQAWKTLHKINHGTFTTGDKILLKRGSRFTGYLMPAGQGSAAAPIIIGAYGHGRRPEIDAHGRYLMTVYIYNMQYVHVTNLGVANTSPAPFANLAGVEVNLYNFGVGHDISLTHLYVHNVYGSDVKAAGGGNGIYCRNKGMPFTYFDHLLIAHCKLAHTDRNGITMWGNWTRGFWHPSLHVVIRNNLLENIGGDGIMPCACDGAVVEYNVIRGARMRAHDYAAGIWPYSCDNTVIQYNDVSGMRGTKDGEGYDSDMNCRNTLIQYNFSHDNDGGFLLICDDGGSHPPWNIGNIGTVVRYNISYDDGDHTFNINGPVTHTHVYNNLFYSGKGRDVRAVASGNWGNAWPRNTTFENNIFVAKGLMTFALGGMVKTLFSHNCFWGHFQNRPADAHAILTNPKLAAPAAGKHRQDASKDDRLLPGSPCVGAGKAIVNNGGRDFFGNPVPAGVAPNVGPWQGKK